MTKLELLQSTANTLLGDNSQPLSADEYLTLIESAKNQAEKDFYSQMYNYLLGKKQQEVIANEKY